MSDFIERLAVFTKLYGKYFFLLIIIILFFAAAFEPQAYYAQPDQENEETGE